MRHGKCWQAITQDRGHSASESEQGAHSPFRVICLQQVKVLVPLVPDDLWVQRCEMGGLKHDRGALDERMDAASPF